MLTAEHLTLTYEGGATVFLDISFRLNHHETLAIIGPSGCGKTSLLYLLCGLFAPTQGRIHLRGKPVQKTSSDIAIILQDFGLLPWKTVLDNVALGLKIRNIPRPVRRCRALELLEDLGLADRGRAYPCQLSGGEQQRVAIARALALQPQLLLMDEPFSSLDAITREKLQHLLLQTWQRTGIPYILVTHSIEEAVFLGSRVLMLAERPASIVSSFINPGFGSAGYRHTEEYFHMIRTIREAMERYW